MAGKSPVSQARSRALFVLAVLGTAVTALFLDPGGGMVSALGKDPTLTGRTEIWGFVLGLHTNPLVGTGFESFWLGPRLTKMRTALRNSLSMKRTMAT